jgi:acyl carrier protein
MGLDTVELVMEIEEAFNITIPDAEAEKIVTVGDLHRYVLTQLRVMGQTASGESGETASRCLSAMTFYRFRRRLMSCLKIRRADIRPDSALEKLMPIVDRRQQWLRLEESLGWKLPALSRPRWVSCVIWYLMMASAPVGFLISHFMGNRNDAAFLGWGLGSFLLAWLLAVALFELTSPIANRFPSDTVRGLIPLLVGSNLATIKDPTAGWTPREVRETIVAIISEQLGVSASSLSDTTHFVNDLGAD